MIVLQYVCTRTTLLCNSLIGGYTLCDPQTCMGKLCHWPTGNMRVHTDASYYCMKYIALLYIHMYM